jgi:hypothetical protein
VAAARRGDGGAAAADVFLRHQRRGNVLAGSLFYVGAVDHKPPGIALTYAFVFWLTGQYRLLFVRILLLAVVAATSVLIGETARLLYGSPRARIAGVLYALASATGVPGDMLAANTELFLNLPLAAAGLLVVRALADDSNRLWPAATVTALAGAGALTGIAALFKYQAAAAVVGWALAVSAAGGGIRRIAPRLAALVAGIAPIALGLCAFYLLRAAWPAFWFWGWQYNFVYMSLVSPSAATWRALYYTTVVGLFWLPLGICIAEPRAPRPVFALAWLIAMIPAVAAGNRFFPHYYLMLLPPLCLLAAPGVLALAEGRPRRRGFVAAFAALAVGVTTGLSWSCPTCDGQGTIRALAVGVTTGRSDVKPAPQHNQRSYLAVAAYVRAHTTPDDRIFVWGNSPEIYFYADRIMGTRFAFCNYLTGKIWGTAAGDTEILDTDRFAVPRAWDELVSDLGRAPPELIVDAAAGKLDGFALNGASRYPHLWEIIQQAYRPEAMIDGVPLYRWTGKSDTVP